MRPIRPEGGGRAPRAKMPTAAADKAAKSKADNGCANSSKNKKRSWALLLLLCLGLIALSVYLTVLAVSGLQQL